MRGTWIGGIVAAAALAHGAGHAWATTPGDPLGADALMGDVRTYAALAPDHLTGTTDSATTQRWVAEQLRAAGLRPASDAYRFQRFTPRQVALEADGVPVHSAVARLYSGTTPPDGLAAPLVYAGYGSATEFGRVDAAHRIAVVDVPTADTATEPTLDAAIAAAKAAGAAGLVAVTEGPEDYPVQEDVDSRAGVLGLPVVFVGKRSGAPVIAAAKAARPGRLLLTADVGAGCDTNLYAVLPGLDAARTIVIGTPTSGFVPAASERGAGVAALLGLARHYAALPLAQRPVTLVFTALTGHEAGFLGLPTLMSEHGAWFSGADAYVHLGASLAARAIAETPSGTIVRPPGDDPTRLLYVSENPILQGIAQQAFAQTGIASASPGVRNVGEQAYAYHAGVPILSISGGSFYFHTAGDQADGVDGAEEAKVAAAFRDAIDTVAALPAGAIAAANPLAAALGARQSPGATPSGGGGAPNPAYEPKPVARCGPAPGAPAGTGDASSTNARPDGIGGVHSVVPTYDDPQPDYPWEGRYQARTFTVPSHATGAKLFGTIFAPLDLRAGEPDARFGSRRPAVVIGPGSGPGAQAFYQWSARDLAGHGYIAITIDPQGVGYSETFPPGGCGVPPGLSPQAVCPGVPFQQVGNYIDALRTGLDYLLSAADPWRRYVDPGHLGIAGHSLSSRAASWLQGADARVHAAVAWDNLTSLLEGDAGTPSGGGTAGDLIGGELPGPSRPVTARVPALGEASDNTGTTEPTNTDPDQKKTGYDYWRAHGKPAMEVVFSGAQHNDWGQSSLTSAKVAAEIQHFEYYTRAWFDRWLLGDRTATDRLLARTVDGVAAAQLMSTKFRSGAFLDGHDCPELARGCG